MRSLGARKAFPIKRYQTSDFKITCCWKNKSTTIMELFGHSLNHFACELLDEIVWSIAFALAIFLSFFFNNNELLRWPPYCSDSFSHPWLITLSLSLHSALLLQFSRFGLSHFSLRVVQKLRNRGWGGGSLQIITVLHIILHITYYDKEDMVDDENKA